MLFTDDIVLVDETREGVNRKLDRWRHILQSRGFRISRSKTKYLHYYFSGREDVRGEVTIKGMQIPKVEKFKYLGLIIYHEGDIDEDISHRIKVGWQKWKSDFCGSLGINLSTGRIAGRGKVAYT